MILYTVEYHCTDRTEAVNLILFREVVARALLYVLSTEVILCVMLVEESSVTGHRVRMKAKPAVFFITL